MNSLFLFRHAARFGGRSPWFTGAACALVLSLFAASTWASPGAHGPNGEHLDSPTAVASNASAAPRMEARSESFELVAHLRDGELSMLIHRFDTNEPVLKAQVEVESGPLKAVAPFHEDMGDYAVDDPALLKALKTPGAHPLVVTILAGNESDLLEGTLQTGAANAAAADRNDHGHAHGDGHGIPNVVWVVLVMLMLAAVSAWMSYRFRKAQGGAQ